MTRKQAKKLAKELGAKYSDVAKAASAVGDEIGVRDVFSLVGRGDSLRGAIAAVNGARSIACGHVGKTASDTWRR